MMHSLPKISMDRTGFHHDEDYIAEENILNIDLVYGPRHNRSHYRLSSILRTPGHDCELVAGLLFSLGIIHDHDDVEDASACSRGRLDDAAFHTMTIALKPGVPFSPLDFSCAIPRFSGCGMCSSSHLDTQVHTVVKDDMNVDISLLLSLAQRMTDVQPIFKKTGGTHAAALFNQAGSLIAGFEDVGRHNALDKLIGCMLAHDRAMLQSGILLMSSRASFEIVQKAARAQIPLVATFSAASSLAIQLADQSCITLVGFLRQERCNVYTHPQRLGLENV